MPAGAADLTAVVLPDTGAAQVGLTVPIAIAPARPKATAYFMILPFIAWSFPDRTQAMLLRRCHGDGNSNAHLGGLSYLNADVGRAVPCAMGMRQLGFSYTASWNFAAVSRSTETSCDTPRSAMVTPNRR